MNVGMRQVSNECCSRVIMRLKLMLAIIFIIIISVSLNATGESLYVFVPSQVRAKVMQQQMSQVCPYIDVTVFAFAKEFRQQLKSTPPNAILSHALVVDRNDYSNTVLQGVKNSQTAENYMVVSIGAPLDLNQLEQKKIGVVDLLGRKPMSDFVSGLLDAVVKLKRVTKIEDLLPMLTFGAAEGILVPESLYYQLKSKSKLNLVATSLNKKMDLASVVLNDESAKEKVVQCITQLGNEVNITLGVDRWLAI